jgi:hypothetical protein
MVIILRQVSERMWGLRKTSRRERMKNLSSQKQGTIPEIFSGILSRSVVLSKFPIRRGSHAVRRVFRLWYAKATERQDNRYRSTSKTTAFDMVR